MIEPRLIVCAIASIAGHYALARSLDELPERPPLVRPRPVAVQVTAPPPPAPEPEPPPAAEPAKPAPLRQPVHQRPRSRPVQTTARDVVPREAAPADPAATATGTSTTPVFGVTMESTSQAGGPAVPVGNTTRPQPRDRAVPGAVAPLAAPVAAHEVTRMPMPQGRCAGTYTEAARQAALEGTVVLDLVVDEHGRTRDIRVVSGLGHGLTEAAIVALRACRFSPGEKEGKAVPVRVRGFKIRFVMRDAQ